MKILFVEDHPSFGKELSEMLVQFVPGVDVRLCRSRDSALGALDKGFFDLLILDLNLPLSDDDMDGAPSHGQAVFYEAKRACPGTPIFILTGSEMDAFSKDLARHGEQLDLWGSREQTPTVVYYEKERARTLIEEVVKVAEQVRAVEAIALNYRGRNLGLSTGAKRCLQVAVRRMGAVSADVVPMGGLSTARVVRVTLRNHLGQDINALVAKLGTVAEIHHELSGFHNHAKLLPMGFVPHLMDGVDKGACGSAGAFYSLAAGFDRSLFEVLLDSQASAAEVVHALRQRMAPWGNASTQRTVTIAELRRRVLWDQSFDEVVDAHGLDFRDIEERPVQAKFCCLHGDLHGANVLVDREHNPALIDFGDAGEGGACLDPIALEFSAAFHPDAVGIGLSAKLDGRMHLWPDRDRYEQDHVFRDFSVACREWAHDVAGSDLAVLAAGYALALRQLRFPSGDKEVKLGLLNAIAAAIRAT